MPRGHSRSNLAKRKAGQSRHKRDQVAPWATRVVQRLTRPICKATGDHKKCGEERNGFFLRPILVLQCDAARMALGHASWYAAPVDHHTGSTGGKYPASSWPQPMVDNSRVCAAGKSDRLMGVCVHTMAELRHYIWPLVATPLKSQCALDGRPNRPRSRPAHVRN